MVLGKVFLSHSSKDKELVGAVYTALGSRLAEYDAETFEGGLPNWEVIVRAFERCNIFALFATSNSLNSAWVQQEVAEARRRIKSDHLKRLLVFVTDGKGLDGVPASLRNFAIFLTLTKPIPIKAAIERHLLELAAFYRQDTGEFVGRDKELAELKAALLDPDRKLSGVSVSGLALLGRSALIRRAMSDLYPALQPAQRAVNFHVFESCADLALDLHGTLHELISPDQIDDYRSSFMSDDASSCGGKIYHLLKKIGDDRQYVIMYDLGGIINHRGGFTSIASSLVHASAEANDLRVFFVTTRRPVTSVRTQHTSLAFVDLHPMSEEAAKQYIVQKARSRNIPLSKDQINQVVDLGRGHVQNIEFILEKCRQYPPSEALVNIDDIFEIRGERSRQLLDGMDLSSDSKIFLAVLSEYFNIPAEFIGSIFDDYERGANVCAELLDKFAIVESHGVYMLSPPLVDAVSRDRSLQLDPTRSKDIARKFAAMLNEYREDGVVPINIIDAASIANIEMDQIDRSNWASLFVLPSHYIYLARHAYNRRQYQKALDHCISAVGHRISLTDTAYIYACRTLGMSAARLGEEAKIKHAVALLNAISDPLARAYAAYIIGFDHRLSGRFAEAHDQYLMAQKTLRDDAALMRELALVNLLRRNTEQATAYGESALAISPNSPYVLDIVARAIISQLGASVALEYDFKLREIMNRLQRACEDGHHSFYELRNAERALLVGNLPEALTSANRAVNITRDLAAPYLIRARVYLAMGRTKDAREDRDAAKARTRMDKGRHTYFEAEIIRVELEIALKRKKYGEAITLHGLLTPFGVIDDFAIAKSIADAIDRDKTDLEPHVRGFARNNR